MGTKPRRTSPMQTRRRMLERIGELERAVAVARTEAALVRLDLMVLASFIEDELRRPWWRRRRVPSDEDFRKRRREVAARLSGDAGGEEDADGSGQDAA